jgi:dTDP-4-dehydrorhamnose 3,5-epimerase-like enzyme
MDSGLEHFTEIAPLEPVAVSADERGRVLEPIPRGLLGSGEVQHLHLIEFTPGAVRGNHVHRLQNEVIVHLGGTILARVEDLATGAAAELELREQALAIRLRPGIAHAFQSIGAASMLSYSDRPYDPGDVERHVLLE